MHERSLSRGIVGKGHARCKSTKNAAEMPRCQSREDEIFFVPGFRAGLEVGGVKSVASMMKGRIQPIVVIRHSMSNISGGYTQP